MAKRIIPKDMEGIILEDIAKLRNEGYSYSEIAERINKEYGIELSQQKVGNMWRDAYKKQGEDGEMIDPYHKGGIISRRIINVGFSTGKTETKSEPEDDKNSGIIFEETARTVKGPYTRTDYTVKQDGKIYVSKKGLWEFEISDPVILKWLSLELEGIYQSVVPKIVKTND